jgi:hypothetical protein
VSGRRSSWPSSRRPVSGSLPSSPATRRRPANALRASLDASTAQNAAQAALYDGYGDLSGHYRTRLGDLDAQLVKMQQAFRRATEEHAACRSDLATLQIECAQLRHDLDILTAGGHP